MKKTTYTLAYEACEAYFLKTGLMPTIESIKPIINVNSPTTISSAIKDWKLNLSQAINKSQPHNPAMPKHLISAMTGIWEEALLEAKKTFDEETVILQNKQAVLENKEKTLNEETSRIRELVQLTAQKYQEEIHHLKKEINRISIESTNLIEKNEYCHTAASKLEKNNAVLSEQLRQEREKYNWIEKQYTKEHEWAIKRIEEEKETIKQQFKTEIDRLKSETDRSKQSSKLLQVKLDSMAKQISKNNEIIMGLESRNADEKLKQAGLILIEAKLQKELTAREEKIRLLLNKNVIKKHPKSHNN